MVLHAPRCARLNLISTKTWSLRARTYGHLYQVHVTGGGSYPWVRSSRPETRRRARLVLLERSPWRRPAPVALLTPRPPFALRRWVCLRDSNSLWRDRASSLAGHRPRSVTRQ